MEEKKSFAPAPPIPPVAEADEKGNPGAPANESNESFLGSLLVTLLVLILVGVVAFFSFFGYRLWRESEQVKNTPSIERMALEKPSPVMAEAPSQQEEKQEESQPSRAVDRSGLDVKVLNGGAARGAAGTFAETLKKAGYAKATAGNSTGDYTGVTIYFAEGKEAEAEALKADVAKTYAAVTVAKAVATNADMTAASFVILLGK